MCVLNIYKLEVFFKLKVCRLEIYELEVCALEVCK